MEEKFEPVKVLAATFTIASLGGLAAKLRSREPLTPRSLIAAVLYAGLLGLLIGLLWFNYFNDAGNIYFLVGVSGMAGIGGMSLMDFVVQAFRNGGINIKISASEEEEQKDDHS